MALGPGALRGRNLLGPGDLSPDEWDGLLALAAQGKANGLPALCAGKTLINVFGAPSLRTRVSMEIAMQQLGGNVVTVNPGSGSWALATEKGVVMDGASPEHVKEAAPVLGSMGDGLAVRTFPVTDDPASELDDTLMKMFAQHAGCPVLSLETPSGHPMQSLADALTMRELLGDEGTTGQPVTLTWAPHPKALPLAVPLSFLHAAAVNGSQIRVAAPVGWELPDDRVAALRSLAESRGGSLETTNDRAAAYAGARVVYAKSWGPTDATAAASAPLKPAMAATEPPKSDWQVTAEAMALTSDAYFMHCLPVRRNVVVSDAVIDSPNSKVVQLAENRLHTARAFLAAWLGSE
jgi:ornithine carbamoyltransferase